MPDFPELGSIGGGGRYDNLASNYTDQKFPGVGASIGLSRLFYVLSENNLLEGDTKSDQNADSAGSAAPVIDYAVIPLDQTVRKTAYQLAEKLRQDGSSVDVILINKKLGDLMKHASKIAKYGIVVGSEEAKSHIFKIKVSDDHMIFHIGFKYISSAQIRQCILYKFSYFINTACHWRKKVVKIMS